MHSERRIVMPTCNNTSVGIIVVRDGHLLVINRKKPPFGIALPAGHVDAENPSPADFESAAERELREETGLRVTRCTLVAEGRMGNPCRRGATWHYWRIYRAETQGQLDPSIEETLGASWITQEEFQGLLDGATLTIAGNDVPLEPVWREWFQSINPFA